MSPKNIGIWAALFAVLYLINLPSTTIHQEIFIQAQKELQTPAKIAQTRHRAIHTASKKDVPAMPVQVSQPKPVYGGNIEQTIRQAAIKHGVSPDWLVGIARCESGLNPQAVNTGYYAGGGHPTGLFQYLPSTWQRIGSRSPYGVGDIYSAHDQAYVTAWAFANGYSGEWECQ